MTKLTTTLLALGLAGVSGSAFACGDAPMSMKDASVAKPTVVASAAQAAPVRAVAKTAPVTKAAATPATKVADQTATRR